MKTNTETSYSEQETTTTTAMPRDGIIASALGMHNGPQGPISKIVNVLGRVALVTYAVLGISRLFGSDEVQVQNAAAAGAYEPS